MGLVALRYEELLLEVAPWYLLAVGVAERVDILVASGTPSVLPARDAAGQIPVVFVATFDPVATGLVASLARRSGG